MILKGLKLISALMCLMLLALSPLKVDAQTSYSVIPGGGYTQCAANAITYQANVWMFITTTNGRIYYQKYSSGTWQGYYTLVPSTTAGVTHKSVTTALIGSNLYVFYTGTDGHLYYTYYNGTTNTWATSNYTVSLGSPLTGLSPTAITLEPNVLDPSTWFIQLYFVGTNGHVYYGEFDGTTWYGPHLVPGTATTGYPVALTYYSYESSLYCHMVGSDNKIRVQTYHIPSFPTGNYDPGTWGGSFGVVTNSPTVTIGIASTTSQAGDDLFLDIVDGNYPYFTDRYQSVYSGTYTANSAVHTEFAEADVTQGSYIDVFLIDDNGHPEMGQYYAPF